MNIQFNIDDDNAVWEVLDQFFVAMLKQQIKNDTEDYTPDNKWMHADDIKEAKKRIKACKTILQYYEV